MERGEKEAEDQEEEEVEERREEGFVVDGESVSSTPGGFHAGVGSSLGTMPYIESR